MTPHDRKHLPHAISEAIEAGGGRITMAHFMELALTDPFSGYYPRVDRLLGYRGDFTTAPNRSPAFGRAIASVVAQVLDLLISRTASGAASVTEVGAGEGDLAAGILSHWDEHRPDLRGRVRYVLVEVGPELRERQRTLLTEATDRGWDVSWAPSLEDCPPAPGVMLTNELVDALPVHLLDVRGSATTECWVRRPPTGRGGAVGSRAASPPLIESWEEPSPEAVQELERVFGTADPVHLRPLSQDGLLEVRPAARAFLAQAARVLNEGALLTIDYGDWLPGTAHTPSGAPGRTAEDPALTGLKLSHASAPPLHARTLRTYLHHERGDDPLLLPGCQDLTADVDFRALHVHGTAMGFSTALYCPLADLLAAAGAADEAAALEHAARRSLDADVEASTLAALLDRTGLGGLFKAMLQTIGD